MKPENEEKVAKGILAIFLVTVFALTVCSCATFIHDYKTHGWDWIVEQCFRK